ncbi:KpsF/GutQ family sugar-phosphate isomerase [Larsenimonas salina]|uniref:KpsF/GutQ family sugar-phosphate isomerase n=1 Tax=Larsenimonas salina TaxID=1295565 RepID=UPI00207328BC|nr:KpsF/GutQ family sugar-phosphate isomerase [Larsenimonas salina]MCM5703114.1 KpsF/GutQ family sugar-phosphate isomerase [Larsenimonas salina]
MPKPLAQFSFIKSAHRTLDLEQRALGQLIEKLDTRFDTLCQRLLACEGRIVVTGMGKSGHIAHKMAATLASTGTPAFFMHPAEASHGDLGMLTPHDVLLALSNSGETYEITALLPVLKRRNIPMLALTGRDDSTLARHADIHLNVGVDQEACPLNLAPTSSTTAALAMGDAIAIALLEARGFSAEDFALSHPGGSLGKRLLLTVDDVMRKGDQLPLVRSGTMLSEALGEISRKGLGFTCIIDENETLVGVYTDGDLRRTIDQHDSLRTLTIDDVMTVGGYTVHAGLLAAEALNILEQHRISALAVIDDSDRPIGVLHMHDLLTHGVV